MKILRISCSPRGQASESRRLSQAIIECLLRREPAARWVDRMIGDGALPHVDANYALSQHSSSAQIAQEGSVTRSDALIKELEDSDVLVIGTPMHNLGVPSALKAWIDHIVRARRTFRISAEGKKGLLRDRPVLVAVASGGRYSGEHAQQPDFLTPYLRAILGTIGLRDLNFFSVQGTGLGADAVAEARAQAERALQAYFSSFSVRPLS
jgi:FMN-dependent NADH-azoreductase